MAAIDDISTQVDALVAQLDTFEAAVTQAFADLNAKIAGLGLDPATVSHITSAISGAQASITSAEAAAKAADPGPPPPPAAASLYTFSGDPSTIDGTQWVATQWVAADGSLRRLYTFTGDTAPGQTNGNGLDGGAWALYTGATQTG